MDTGRSRGRRRPYHAARRAPILQSGGTVGRHRGAAAARRHANPMKFRVIAVGHKMPIWISTGFDEYAQRMPRESRIELHEIKPAARSGDKSIAQWLATEAERVTAALPGRGFKIVLDERGGLCTTADLARRIERWKRLGDDVSFVIGG